MIKLDKNDPKYDYCFKCDLKFVGAEVCLCCGLVPEENKYFKLNLQNMWGYKGV